MRMIVFFAILLLAPLSAFGSPKIVLITDEPSAASATAVREELLRTPPFSLISDLEISIAKVAPGAVSCNLIFNRVVDCDPANLLTIAAENNTEHAIYIREDATYGGSGGSVPVINSGSPPNMAIHEFLHKFGFADEYPYSAEEAHHYCSNARTPNVAFFNDTPPYSSDGHARQEHSADIPWYGEIRPATLITSGSDLGTPRRGVVGLFRSVTCDNANPPVASWKPGSEPTIMENLETNHIPRSYWPAILTGLNVDPAQANRILAGSNKHTPSPSRSSRSTQ